MKRTDFESVIRSATGCTRKQSSAAVSALIEALTSDVAAGNSATVIGVGTLKTVSKPERKSRNPKTGETITVPAKKVIVFKPGKAFKEKL
ncbi:MAG: HU family DNA-binding protein [Clostridia bacterium]|nr:HU family DNA-binding protein [Clostridia bacterium]MBP5269666.1 HU family DNA-binding protein [Clostridia bacterium]